MNNHTCHFCNSILVRTEHLSKIIYSCNSCSTKNIKVGKGYIFTFIIYKNYRLLFDYLFNTTHIYINDDYLIALDNTFIDPSNVTDKLPTYLLLS